MSSAKVLAFDWHEELKLDESFYRKSDKRDEMNYVFSNNNPFLKDMSIRFFQISDRARLVGFIPKSNIINNEEAAFFGFWDSENNDLDHTSLFDEFESWAMSKGIKQVFGPINFNTYFDYRLKLAASESDSFFLEPSNNEYMVKLLGGIGYKPEVLYLTYEFRNFEKLSKHYLSNINIGNLKSLKSKYVFRFVDKDYWLKHIDDIYELCDEIFKNNFAYSKCPKEFFKVKFGEEMANALCSKTSISIEDKEGKIVGMCINFPDYQNTDVKRVLIKTAGVTKDHRHMGMLFMLLVYDVISAVLEEYDEAYFCLMAQNNFPTMIVGDTFDAKREYALFRKDI
ncbi:MAG: hypothetical protein ACI9QD_001147 [Thermoproteota archaeon]|jgi:hypothetical protein